MYESQRLQQVTELINQYTYEQPLIQYLKNYFKENKKLGSRDRRQVQELIFDFYRLGKALAEEDIKTRIAVSHFLRNKKQTNFSDYFSEVISSSPTDISKSLIEKESQIQKSFSTFSIKSIFPSKEFEISDALNSDQLATSILIPSITWLRAKRTHIKDVRKELELNKIKYIISKKSRFAIGIEIKADFSKMKTYKEGMFEVQDISSQLAVDYMSVKSKQNWWDVCCGSGGKSLLVKDQGFDIHMTLSDNRKSILHNLEKRFKKAKIKPDQIIELDATKKEELKSIETSFDRIILDAPCSGSGTWSRNPEYILKFNKKELIQYNSNQKRLLQNALTKLKDNGELYYITCSAFKSENEDVFTKVLSNTDYKVSSSKMISCIQNRGDNLFISVIKKI